MLDHKLKKVIDVNTLVLGRYLRYKVSILFKPRPNFIYPYITDCRITKKGMVHDYFTTYCREIVISSINDIKKFEIEDQIEVRHARVKVQYKRQLCESANNLLSKIISYYQIKPKNILSLSVIWGITNHLLHIPDTDIEKLAAIDLNKVLNFLSIVGPKASPLKFNFVAVGSKVYFTHNGKVLLDWFRSNNINLHSIDLDSDQLGIQHLSESYEAKIKDFSLRKLKELKEFAETDFDNIYKKLCVDEWI